MSIVSVTALERNVLSTLGWRSGESRSCAPCITAAAVLVCFMYSFDGRAEPPIRPTYRIAIGDIVETCVIQGAWIWCSGLRRGKEEASSDLRLEEPYLGVYTYLGCIGAGVMILANGFETFSSQMVSFDEMPTVDASTTNSNVLAALPPLRAATWRNTSIQGASSGWSPVLSGASNIRVLALVLSSGLLRLRSAWDTRQPSDGKSVKHRLPVRTSALLNGQIVVVDIPPELNVDRIARYFVLSDSIRTLRDFMNSLMPRSVTEFWNTMECSSDSIQTMRDVTHRSSVLRVEVVYAMVMMLLAFYYLAQTVWRTARDQVSAWKGGLLPTLFCLVEKDSYAEVDNPMDVPNGLDKQVG
ncbi:hypothetical protein DL766_007597 [Monosporascus sp. MC13-8B]|nr:hypothetical protein DL763_006892 [Monosporascus cannonballus]RYP22910.1 hypothetical protein DL766_007597 [Monosporascus sp. MC13-8B]